MNKPRTAVSHGSHGRKRAAAAMEPVTDTIRTHRLVGPALTFDEHLYYDGTQLSTPDAELADLYSRVAQVIASGDSES